jgi:hypothetical protein
MHEMRLAVNRPYADVMLRRASGPCFRIRCNATLSIADDVRNSQFAGRIPVASKRLSSLL